MTDVCITLLKALASISSLCMCLSPAPSIYRVYKSQSIGQVSIIPLVSLWATCHVWMLYGLLVGSIFPLFITYITGDVFAILFVGVYISVTSAKSYVVKVTGAVGAFLLLLTLYAVLGRFGVTGQTAEQIGQTVGFVGVGVSVVLYASPFETIKQVVHTKSAATIPIVMCVVGSVSNSLWVVYGIVDTDLFVIVPNVICVALGLVQVVLYFVFLPRHSHAMDPRTKFDTPTELLTPMEDINIAMSSPEDEFDIVISPMSSVL